MQNMIKSYLLIIGAMKSGTTTLFNTLSQHPQIAASSNKEPGFFCFDEIYSKGYAWYDSRFGYVRSKHLYSMEATTDYTKFPFCGEHMLARLNLDPLRQFKLIYIMRHPLRRIESHAKHAQWTGSELDGLVSDRYSHSLDFGISPLSLAVTKYAYQLDRFKEYFDRGDLLLLTLEELEINEAGVIRRVCDFLKIAYSQHSGSVVGAENSSLSRLTTHPIWDRARKLPMLTDLTKMLVPPKVRHLLWRSMAVLMPMEGRFKLSQGEERELLVQLAPDLRRLKAVYGVDPKAMWGIDI